MITEAYIIHSPEFEMSIAKMKNVARSCEMHGIKPIPFTGVNPQNATRMMQELNIGPYLARGVPGLFRNGGIKGCFMSHYSLWNKCIENNEDMFILEHDAVVIRPIPEDLEFIDLIDLDAFRNETYALPDPLPLVEVGQYSDLPDREIFDDGSFGTKGTQAYLIHPHAAKILVERTHSQGFMPADNMLNSGYLNLQYANPQITTVDGNVAASQAYTLCGHSRMWNSLR